MGHRPNRNSGHAPQPGVGRILVLSTESIALTGRNDEELWIGQGRTRSMPPHAFPQRSYTCVLILAYSRHTLAVLVPYSCDGHRSGPSRGSRPLLGLRLVSSLAGRCCPQPAWRTRCLRGHADWWREVAVLPVAGGDFWRKDSHRSLSADRPDAGSGGATDADGDSGGAAEQHLARERAVRHHAPGRDWAVPAALSFSGTVGAGGYHRLAAACANFPIRD